MNMTQCMVAGQARPVTVVGRDFDPSQLLRDVMDTAGPLAVDVEATGLEMFAKDYHLRMIQFATTERAWVVLWEEADYELQAVVRRILAERPLLLFHNASYDILAMARFGIVDIDDAWGRTADTRILSHLLDPRSREDGAVGHRLVDLVVRYVGDHDAERYETDLFNEFRAMKVKRNEGYAAIDLHSEVYHRYGAADVLQTAWLYEALSPLVEAQSWSRQLCEFEHDVARLCCVIQAKGLLVDEVYANKLIDDLDKLALEGVAEAKSFGVENINSTSQVSEALLALGATLTHRTPSGLLQVNKDVLESVAKFGDTAPAMLAKAVMQSKNAAKFKKAYVQASLDARDECGRVHPSINALQARTARMSVSGPPLQQLPSRDWLIRRMFVPSEGCLIGAADYSQIELRMVGALAQDQEIMTAVRTGIDLHDRTADLVGLPRRVAKQTNFLVVYGGGAGKLSLSAGIPEREASDAIKGWWRTYRGVRKYRDDMIRKTDQGRKPVVTATGRRLPLDRNRVYAGLNYVVQSSSRDVLASALLELEKAGLRDYLLLPIHDEVLFEAPADDAANVAKAIGEAMTMTLMGMPFEAEGEVYGTSWGAGYGAPE